MKLWPHFDVLAGSMALLILSVAVPCVPAAPPTPEPADAGVLRAPEPNPKRGGVLKWGGSPTPRSTICIRPALSPTWGRKPPCTTSWCRSTPCTGTR